ncbi:MAG: phytoene/squalene synthase family protein [Gemmatimonadaceae bacterium]
MITHHDAAICEAVVRRHAHTFALASRFLPPGKRRAAFALYAFCRVADDMVDRAAITGAEGVAGQLDAYVGNLEAAVGGTPEGPVFRELARAVTIFGVPSAVLHELVNGVARDLRPVRYTSWSELARYCEGVASSVGEMCTYVFGVPDGAEARTRALRYARTLGVAMQLTNILRDVGEDARIGRCYLPDEDLAAFGLRREDVLSNAALADNPRWRPFMAFQIARARALYAAATPGIALLAPDSRRCATACATGYAAILRAIELNGYDSLRRRARVGRFARVGILWDVVRSGHRAPALAPVGDGPSVGWDPAANRDLVKWA